MLDEVESRGPEAAYFDYLAQEIFALQVCEACRSTVFPPKRWCSTCESGSLSWSPCAGEGVVYTCTTVRAVEKGQQPHNVSLIDLDVGVRIMSTVVGISPDDVKIGMRVMARIENTGSAPRVIFDPVETRGA